MDEHTPEGEFKGNDEDADHEKTPSDAPSESENRDGGPYATLRKIIVNAETLPPKERTRILAGVVLAILIIAAIPFINNINPPGVILIAVVCGSLLVIVLDGKALANIIVILSFVLIALSIVILGPQMKNAINTTAVAGPIQLDTASGTVMDSATRTVLPRIIVRTLGDGDLTHQGVSDSYGSFMLVVPHQLVKGGFLNLSLEDGVATDTIEKPFRRPSASLTLFFHARRLAKQDSSAYLLGRALMMVLPTARGYSIQPRNVVMTLDSILTIKDGSRFGGADWTFDVNPSDGRPIHVSTARYDDTGKNRLMLVGAETGIPAPGDTVSISVVGRRQFLVLFNYRISGSLTVPASEITSEEPLRRMIVVRNGDSSKDGEFHIFVTFLQLRAQAKLPGSTQQPQPLAMHLSRRKTL